MAVRKSKGKDGSPGNVQDGQTPFRLDFGERMRWLLDLFATRVEAGEVSDISPEHLPAYIRGSVQPRFDTVARLAAAKNVSLAWMASGEGPRYLSAEAPEGFATVALQADGETRFDDGNEPRIMFAKAWLRTLTAAPAECLRLVVHRGNSNEPVIRNGETMLVDTSVERIAGDGLYVFARDDKFQAKFVETFIDGRVALKSRNPDYGVQTLSADETSRLTPFGRVCWRGGPI